MTEVLEDRPVASDSVYARLGGAPAIQALVERFYALMDELPEAHTVRQLHPDSLAGSADSLFKFLSGWFGGPPLYIRERGHPRLRMRHAHFTIGQAERDAWAGHMLAAIDEAGFVEPARSALREYFERAATFLINANANPNSVELIGCPSSEF